MSPDEANKLLPDKAAKAVRDPLKSKITAIGPPKWGKTTLFCDAEDSILLATEEGHLFHEHEKIVITGWDRPFKEKREGPGVDEIGIYYMSLMEAVEILSVATKYKFIILDTVDMAAKMCLDWHYQKKGIEHATDAGDFGRGWDVTLNQPMRQMIAGLMKTGRGLGMITHSKLVTTQKNGKVISARWETTLPSGVQHLIHTQSDLILHCSFGHKRKGMKDRDRVISTDGTNEILAGSRVHGLKLPAKYVVDPDHPWQQLTSFFNDEKTVDHAEREYRRLVLGGVDEDDLPETISTEPTKVEGAAAPAKEIATLQKPKQQDKTTKK